MLIHVKKATAVKHSQARVKAVSLRLWRYQQTINQFSTHSTWYGSIGLITSMKQLRFFQCLLQLSLHVCCFNTSRLLFNKLRIGINISAPSTIILPIRRITLGYVIHLSNIKVSELACMKYLATAV
jgi:hypothetical protein